MKVMAYRMHPDQMVADSIGGVPVEASRFMVKPFYLEIYSMSPFQSKLRRMDDDTYSMDIGIF